MLLLYYKIPKNARLKVFCTWEFRITSICMNKYTTQRKMFKCTIQVGIRYKMAQLLGQLENFKEILYFLNLKGSVFLYTL